MPTAKQIKKLGNFEYKLFHQSKPKRMNAEQKKSIQNVISDIMINDGPDGHCDGSDVIANYVEALLDGKRDEWEKKYFDYHHRHYTEPDS